MPLLLSGGEARTYSITTQIAAGQPFVETGDHITPVESVPVWAASQLPAASPVVEESTPSVLPPSDYVGPGRTLITMLRYTFQYIITRTSVVLGVLAVLVEN